MVNGQQCYLNMYMFDTISTHDFIRWGSVYRVINNVTLITLYDSFLTQGNMIHSIENIWNNK